MSGPWEFQGISNRGDVVNRKRRVKLERITVSYFLIYLIDPSPCLSPSVFTKTEGDEVDSVNRRSMK